MVVTAARGWRCASAGRRHMQVASGTAAASPSLGLSAVKDANVLELDSVGRFRRFQQKK